MANEFSNSVTPISTATRTAGTATGIPGKRIPVVANTTGESMLLTPDGKIAYVLGYQRGATPAWSLTPVTLATRTAARRSRCAARCGAW